MKKYNMVLEYQCIHHCHEPIVCFILHLKIAVNEYKKSTEHIVTY
jgi:hypothetical protein